MRQTIDHFNAQIQAATRNSGDDKLAIFRQHAQAQANKLAEKEQELESRRAEADILKRQVDEMESKLSEISGPKYMKREEFTLAEALKTSEVLAKLQQPLQIFRRSWKLTW